MTTTARPTTTTTSVVALTFSYHQSAPVTGTPVCEPPGSCVIPFSLTGSNTGDLEGTFAQAGAAAVLPDRTIHAYGTVVFTGIVAGCGTGTLVFGSTGINRSGATSGGVEILAGTGDLEGMTGTGTIVSGAGEPSGEGTGTIEMQVTCS